MLNMAKQLNHADETTIELKKQLSDIENSTEIPWEQMYEAGETDKNFEWFSFYLRLPKDNRTLTQAVLDFRRSEAKKLGQPIKAKGGVPGSWIAAKKAFSWDERCAAYDDFIIKDLQNFVASESVLSLLKFRKKQTLVSAMLSEAAEALVIKALSALENIDVSDIRASTIPPLLQVASLLIKESTNLEATALALNRILERVQQSGTGEIGFSDNVTVSELEQYEKESLDLDGIEGL